MIPASYEALLAVPGLRRLLAAVTVSYLGDYVSTVTIAWLALQIGPRGHQALFVGAAVSAYSLPAVVGTFVLNRALHRRPARVLVAANAAVKAVLLAAIAILYATGGLRPALYVALLAAASLLAAWGLAGEYTLLGEVVGPTNRLAVNALLGSLASVSVITAPALAGALIGPIGPGWLILADALSFAYLGVQAWRTRPTDGADEEAVPVDTTKAASGLRIIRAQHLLGLLIVTWLFFFLYGPVEVALPVHVSRDLHSGAGTLGIYWAVFGVGGLLGSLATTALRHRPPWPTVLVIIAGWGLCLLPFGFGAPTFVSVIGFGVGGLIYGPFVPLSYNLFQTSTPASQRPTVLAARSALIALSSPLGTALGGPLTEALGATRTLTLSGAATVLLAAVTAVTRGMYRRTALASPVPDVE